MESRESFAALYCQKHNLAPARFVEDVLAQALYPHAHVPFMLLTWLRPAYGVADLDFITGVGKLSRLHDFWAEADYYAHHPRNLGFLRQGLRLRVSARRLRTLMKETLQVTATEVAWPSATPWPARDPAPMEKADRGAP
jgi:hypothetical protein